MGTLLLMLLHMVEIIQAIFGKESSSIENHERVGKQQSSLKKNDDPKTKKNHALASRISGNKETMRWSLWFVPAPPESGTRTKSACTLP